MILGSFCRNGMAKDWKKCANISLAILGKRKQLTWTNDAPVVLILRFCWGTIGEQLFPNKVILPRIGAVRAM